MKINIGFYDKAALIIIIIFVLISIIKINEPGVTSDQLLFVNAAIGPLDQSYIYKTIHGFPILLMIYIGALKSYIYKPIFYLFGVSIYSIRLPVILIMASALYFLYKAICLKIDKKVAFFTILILATDPSNIAYSRVDNGPTVLEFFFKCLSLFFVFFYFKVKKRKYLFFLICSLGLGLFNKVNFIWFINSLFLSMLVFYRSRFMTKGKFHLSRENLTLIIFYALFLCYSVFILRKATTNYSVEVISFSITRLQDHITAVINNFVNLLSGESFFSSIYGKSPHHFTSIYSLTLIIVNCLGVIYFIKNRAKISGEVTKFYFFASLIFLSLLIQLFITSNAISPWHTYSLYPFLTILTAIFLFELQKTFLNKFKITYILLSCIILYNIFTYSLYISAYIKPVNNLRWSDRFYELVKFTDSYPGIVLVTDIGLQANLLTFSKNYKKYTPIEWMVETGAYETYKSALQGYFKRDPNILVIVTNYEMVIFKDVQPNYFRFIRDYKINLSKIKEFKDGDKVVYTVYKLN